MSAIALDILQARLEACRCNALEKKMIANIVTRKPFWNLNA